MAFGVAGLSVLTDSLSAIEHAAVTPVLDDNTGLCVGFERIGDWPAFGNDDDSVDSIAVKIVTDFHAKLQSRRMYRDATPTLIRKIVVFDYDQHSIINNTIVMMSYE